MRDADAKTHSTQSVVLEVKPRERPSEDAIAWLLVERTEFIPPDSGAAWLEDASISLAYQRLDRRKPFGGGGADRGEFLARCRHDFGETANAVSITGGAVFLDLPGLEGNRIGTYLMNEIVKWAKDSFPEARILPINLLVQQANGENRERRNRFYEQFGIVFEFTTSENKEGKSKRMLAKDLKTVDTWQQNITVHSVESAMSSLLQEHCNLRSEVRSLKSTLERIQAWRQAIESHPLRWAIQHLLGRT